MSQFQPPKKRQSDYQIIVYNTSKVAKRPFEISLKPGVFWVVAGIVLLLFAGIGAALTLYTPLIKLAPGVVDQQTYARDVTLNKLRIDSLKNLVKSRTDYFSQFRELMKPDTLDTTQRDIKPGAEGVIGQSFPDLVTKNRAQGAVPDGFDDTHPDLGGGEGDPTAGEAMSSVDFSAGTFEESQASGFSAAPFSGVAPVKGILTRGVQPVISHFGADIAVKKGTPVSAMSSGKIIFVDWTFESGYTVIIQHANEFISVYKHLSASLVKENQQVTTGEAIALSGNSGELTTGPHLHVELWHKGNSLNPVDYFQVRN